MPTLRRPYSGMGAGWHEGCCGRPRTRPHGPRRPPSVWRSRGAWAVSSYWMAARRAPGPEPPSLDWALAPTRERPIVAVGGDAQPDLFRRHLGRGLHHLTHSAMAHLWGGRKTHLGIGDRTAGLLIDAPKNERMSLETSSRPGFFGPDHRCRQNILQPRRSLRPGRRRVEYTWGEYMRDARGRSESGCRSGGGTRPVCPGLQKRPVERGHTAERAWERFAGTAGACKRPARPDHRETVHLGLQAVKGSLEETTSFFRSRIGAVRTEAVQAGADSRTASSPERPVWPAPPSPGQNLWCHSPDWDRPCSPGRAHSGGAACGPRSADDQTGQGVLERDALGTRGWERLFKMSWARL